MSSSLNPAISNLSTAESTRRRSSRRSTNSVSANAAIALPASPRVIAAALEGSALADDDDEPGNVDREVDVKARYGRRASKNAEREETKSLRRRSSTRHRPSVADSTRPALPLAKLSEDQALAPREPEPAKTTARKEHEAIKPLSSLVKPGDVLQTHTTVGSSSATGLVFAISDESSGIDVESGRTQPVPFDAPDAPTPEVSLSRAESLAYESGDASEVEQMEIEDSRDTGSIASMRGFLILTTTCVAQLLDNVSMTSVNIALPAIADSLHISNADLQWLISGYTLTFGGFLLLAGVFADRYGKKKVFIIGMTWLSLWTLVDSFATSEVQLIIFRALQGLGAAGTVPSAIGIISSYFLGHDRNRALSIFGAFGAIGFVVGLIFGGIFTQALGWRYVFRITAPIGLAVAVMASFVLPKDKVVDGPKPALDFLGAGLGTGGLIVLTFVLTSGGVVGWAKAYVIALIFVSVAMLIGFALAEKKVKNPLLPSYLWKAPNFAASWVCGFLMYCWWQAVVMYIVLIAQEINHLNALGTAVRFIPMGFVGFTMSIVVGRVIHKYSVRTLLAGGMLLCTITCIPACVMTEHSSFWVTVFPVSLMGVGGISIAYNVVSIAMMASVPPAAKSLAGGLANTAFQLGSGVGLAITSAVAQAVLKKAGDDTVASLLKSYQAAMWTSCGLAGAGAVLSVFGLAPDLGEPHFYIPPWRSRH